MRWAGLIALGFVAAAVACTSFGGSSDDGDQPAPKPSATATASGTATTPPPAQQLDGGDEANDAAADGPIDNGACTYVFSLAETGTFCGPLLSGVLFTSGTDVVANQAPQIEVPKHDAAFCGTASSPVFIETAGKDDCFLVGLQSADKDVTASVQATGDPPSTLGAGEDVSMKLAAGQALTVKVSSPSGKPWKLLIR